MVKSILLTLCIPFLLQAQGWNKQVESNDGKQLSFVIIQNESSNNWIISDEFGNFQISKLGEAIDTVRIQRYGYQTLRLSLGSILSVSKIIMIPDPLILDPIKISTQVKNNSMSPQPMVLPDIKKSGSSSLRRYFSGLPGISLRTYGGPGSIGTISLDGGSAGNTKILIDGFDLTSTQNGQLDISQFPLPFIQNAKLEPQSSTINGSGASDGTITLHPWWNSTGFSISAGSFGHSSVSGTLLMQEKQRSIRLLLGKRKDNGNFPVKWRNLSQLRKNNDFTQLFSGFQYRQILSPKMFIKILGLFTDQDRGVPGTVWAPSAARRTDGMYFIGSTLGWFTEKGSSHIKLLWKKSDEKFSDDWFNIMSKHKVSIVSGLFVQEFQINSQKSIFLRTSVQKDGLESTDTGNKFRQVASQSFVYKSQPFDHWVSQLSGRVDVEQKQSPVLTYGGMLKRKMKFPVIDFVAINYESGYRRPSFNELYWNPGGNPDLDPEKSHSTSMTISFEEIPYSKIQVNFFSKASENLIQWVPYVSYWRPVNIAKASRYGIKILHHWQIPEVNINGYFSYYRIKSINQQEGTNRNKSLRYSPSNTFSAQINWNYSKWSITGDIQHTGKVLSVYDWPEDLYLPSVSLINASFSYSKPIKAGILGFTLSLDNITEIKYQSMLGYPEMGRSYRFTIKLEKK